MLPLMRQATQSAETSGERNERCLDGALRAVSGAHPNSEAASGEPPWIRIDSTRPIIIGVLPHSQCNPRVKGCGFCTFPHDDYDKRRLEATSMAVALQIDNFFEAHPNMATRRVEAVYFGGATANLTPKEDFKIISEVLTDHLDLRHAEVTLEGVPSLFCSIFPGTFEAFLAIPARHRRISMGVQTFDAALISRMGRKHFGGFRVVQKAVEKAHRSGLTASGDILINLPFGSRELALRDLDQAISAGFDQICIYHLVLTEDQGTPWAKDPTVLAALPSRQEACETWLAVREKLLTRGYVQTTLTNFERADVHTTERRFRYEECSFAPDQFDAVGFGPFSLSTFIDLERRRAVKLARGRLPSANRWGVRDLYFPYEEEDLRLLFLTRTLVRLSASRLTYRNLFGADITEHFGPALDALDTAALLHVTPDALELTPRGMFYADSVAGLLAWPRVEALRASGAGYRTSDLLREEPSSESFMG